MLYKWSFLAKCHVSIKSQPTTFSPTYCYIGPGEEQKSGEFGSFGCVFCACEAQRRGWALSGNDILTDTEEEEGKNMFRRAKEKRNGDAASIAESAGGGGGTPIFGNVSSFMEHLQVHRREEMRPGIEMCGRLKAVVGRAPAKDEDFEIALLPL